MFAFYPFRFIDWDTVYATDSKLVIKRQVYENIHCSYTGTYPEMSKSEQQLEIDLRSILVKEK